MKIKSQFILMVALFGMMLLIISISVVATNQQVERLDQQQELSHSIERSASELGYLSNEYVLYRESQQRARWESKFASLSNDLSKLNPASPEQQAIVNSIKGNGQRLRAVFADIVAAFEGAAQAQDAETVQAMMQVSWSRMAVQNQGMMFDALRLSQLLRDQIDLLKQRNILLIFALLGLFSAYFLSNYLILYRRTFKSISELEAGTTIIGAGNLDFAIAVKHDDEIGALARAFNRMTANLKEVTASKADLEREIAERKRAEEALARSSSKLAQVLGSIQDDFYVLDRDWKFVYASRQFTSRIGKEPEDFVGNCIWEMFPKHVGTVLEENYRATMEKRESRRFEVGGKYTDAWYSMASFPSEEGITVLGTDITERKRAEEALRESEKRYRLLVQHAPAGIYEVVFPTGQFTEVNDVMCQILGYTHDEFLAMTAFDILDDEGRTRFASRVRQGQSGAQPEEHTSSTGCGRRAAVSYGPS